MKKNNDREVNFETKHIGHKKLTELIEKYYIDKVCDVGLIISDTQNLITGINTAPLMPLKGDAKPRADKLLNGTYGVNQFFYGAMQREVDNLIAHCCAVGISNEHMQIIIDNMPKFKQAAINYSEEQNERPPRTLLMDNNLKFTIIANILDILVHSTKYQITSSGNDEHPTPAMKFCMEVLTLLNIQYMFTYSNIHNSIQKYKKL